MDPLLNLGLKTVLKQGAKRLGPVIAEDLAGPIGLAMTAVSVFDAVVRHYQEAALSELSGKLGCKHIELCKLDGPIATFREVQARQGSALLYNSASLWHPQWKLDSRGFVPLVDRYNPDTGQTVRDPGVLTFACQICNPPKTKGN